jgi:hypothetical protein
MNNIELDLLLASWALFGTLAFIKLFISYGEAITLRQLIVITIMGSILGFTMIIVLVLDFIENSKIFDTVIFNKPRTSDYDRGVMEYGAAVETKSKSSKKVLK